MPFALRVGTGEGALLVAEELALEQILRDGVAIDGDKRSVGLRAPAVESLRHHFLAGAVFAEDQDGRAGRSHLANEGEDGLHLWAAAQHVLEDLNPLALLHGAVFLLE